MNATPLKRLGDVDVAEFLRTTWQRRPRLIRQALPRFASPVEAAVLFALAARDDVESRLVTAFGRRWRLRHGPFDAAALPAPARRGWTLLVQGVDLYLPQVAALRERFRFISDARLDDVMVSYASDGGGVGPHVDSYDVFLLQAQGRRRWRISRQRDLDLVPGLPLRILADFRATEDWVLEPGDLLYLPPGVAHEGTAVGSDCITCSIGFRAPRYRDLADPWLDALAERAHTLPALQAQLADPGARTSSHPARLPAAMIDAAHERLAALKPAREDALAALLAVLSEPKPVVSFDPPQRPLSVAGFIRRAAAKGVQLDLRTRMLYAEGRVGINGECLQVQRLGRATLARLADRRALSPPECRRLSDTVIERLHEWYVSGWLHPG
jgi:50S ribosomal protein L16 3-hydroxylase